MSRGKKKPSLRDLSHSPLTASEIEEHNSELLVGSDRAVALIACANLENALVLALRARLVPMNETEVDAFFYGQTAVLPNFASQIKMEYAIGIYGHKLKKALDTIRNIRNQFAHSVRVIDFDNDLIINECLNLPDMK